MLKHLVKLADQLDRAGLNREAEFTDGMIAKLAEEFVQDESIKPEQHLVQPGDTMTGLTQMVSAGTTYTVADNVALNKKHDPTFNPDHLTPGQMVWLWTPAEYESN